MPCSCGAGTQKGSQSSDQHQAVQRTLQSQIRGCWCLLPSSPLRETSWLACPCAPHPFPLPDTARAATGATPRRRRECTHSTARGQHEPCALESVSGCLRGVHHQVKSKSIVYHLAAHILRRRASALSSVAQHALLESRGGGLLLLACTTCASAAAGKTVASRARVSTGRVLGCAAQQPGSSLLELQPVCTACCTDGGFVCCPKAFTRAPGAVAAALAGCRTSHTPTLACRLPLHTP